MSTAVTSTTACVLVLLVLGFVPKQREPSFLKFEVLLLCCLVPLFIGMILLLRPKFLIEVLAPFGIPDLDMNVEFRPKQPLVRLFWLVSSIFSLSLQLVIVTAMGPVVLIWKIIRLIFQSSSEVAGEVPTSARLLLLLAPKQYRESLVGDLEEEFQTIMLPRYGARLARWWYCEQVACSLWPLFWNLLKRGAGAALLWKMTK